MSAAPGLLASLKPRASLKSLKSLMSFKNFKDCQDIKDQDISDRERQPCEVWTRVMGYHRPVSAFNRGKQAEHRERKAFREHR